MMLQYRGRDLQIGARKELEELFRQPGLAKTDFLKYSEKFKTLAKTADLNDSYLKFKLLLAAYEGIRGSLTRYNATEMAAFTWKTLLDEMV